MSWIDLCIYKPAITLIQPTKLMNFYSIVGSKDDSTWEEHIVTSDSYFVIRI